MDFKEGVYFAGTCASIPGQNEELQILEQWASNSCLACFILLIIWEEIRLNLG